MDPATTPPTDAEIARLRHENQRLKYQNQKLKGRGGNRACLFGALAVGGFMIAIAVVSVLAAIALPMYSQFKRKVIVATYIKPMRSLVEPMTLGYQADGGFPESFAALDEIHEKYGVVLPSDERASYNYWGTSDAMNLSVTLTEMMGDDIEVTLEINCESGPCSSSITCSQTSLGLDWTSDQGPG